MGAFYTTGGAEGPPVGKGLLAGFSALTVPSASCDPGSCERALRTFFVKIEVLKKFSKIYEIPFSLKSVNNNLQLAIDCTCGVASLFFRKCSF